MCGQIVTFPAIPPGRAGPSLRVKSQELKAVRNWSVKTPKALVFLRDFQHWNTVAQCAVPFVIIGVLLGGAIFVKNKLGAPVSSVGDPLPAAPAVASDQWDKNVETRKAAQAVETAMKVLEAANANLDSAVQARQHYLSTDSPLRKAAEDRVQQAQAMVNAARKQFEAAQTKYQQLGGEIDYRSKLKKY